VSAVAPKSRFIQRIANVVDVTLFLFALSAVSREKPTADFGINQSWDECLPLSRSVDRELGAYGRLFVAMRDLARSKPRRSRELRNGDGARLCDLLHELPLREHRERNPNSALRNLTAGGWSRWTEPVKARRRPGFVNC
jgi:hypothetical protein